MNVGLLLVWIVVFFAIFYFLAIRPQRRQRQAHVEMTQMLKKGDEVVTIGGLFGTVRKIGDDWVELEVARGTRVRFLKRAVSSIVSEDDEYGEDELVGDDSDADVEEAEYVDDGPDLLEEATDDTPDAPEAPEPPRR